MTDIDIDILMIEIEAAVVSDANQHATLTKSEVLDKMDIYRNAQMTLVEENPGADGGWLDIIDEAIAYIHTQPESWTFTY